jgi:DNA primase
MDLNGQSKLQLEAAQRYAQEISPEALVALEERGISELVAAKYQLGTVVDPLNGHEQYAGWISIPYITALGHCVGFKFRRLDGGLPKYGSPTGQKAHLYNVNDTTILSKHIVVCEGELDTVIVSGVLGIPAVGIPGVQAWKPHFSKLLAGYDSVYIVGDNDVKEDGSNPGQDFAKRVQQEVLNGVLVSLPPNMDINDYYLAYGADVTKTLLVGEQIG